MKNWNLGLALALALSMVVPALPAQSALIEDNALSKGISDALELPEAESRRELARIVDRALNRGSLTSPEALKVLGAVLSTGLLDDQQLLAIRRKIEKEKTSLKDEDKQLALELISFARLDHADKVATCVNTSTPPANSAIGFVRDLLGSNVGNYLKFIDVKKKDGKGNAISNGVGSQWSGVTTGSNNYASAEQYCRGVLAKVYSGGNKSLTDSLRTADEAIEGMAGAGAAR